ncbi:prolyl-tRNA synthetase [Desulfonauticus submarinus]|uniref:Proline--tRNA ligase n=1 Tax=Desulfonauticus submarinus TaxID=206665 RepID=A0A1G9ZM35_9BACT|nr:proline--tRNA ligase [Desulfonauticus submarinus]SDN21613.1 prolyl-tRNA synthetase [Desulfonauticus submarinus]
MRWSRYYIPTLKEDPADAEVISHKLLLRAGMIRKLTAGIYTYLPLALRCLQKISQIIREEMERFGAVEILMPGVQPAELWKQSGRWDAYGKELLRFKDRHDRDYCLGPTHEEVVTNLIKGEVKSYRQLPLNLYQIQTKFRDEIRPRFGLMRGREFIMKDGYSFDKDDKGAISSYENMYEAYKSIFTRLGLKFRAVEADTGQIGGTYSHEFMVLADTGEDTIVVCEECDYAANLEKAEVLYNEVEQRKIDCPPLEEVNTPNKHTVEEVAKFLNIFPHKIVKTLLYNIDGKVVAILIRGDRELNEVKLKNKLKATEVRLATKEEVEKYSGAPVGFAGPVGLNIEEIYADQELQFDTDYVIGANKKDTHFIHCDLKRDVNIKDYYDLRNITVDDNCPKCGGKISLTKGIEVGHIFKLGTKYSKAMGATFLDENGKEKPLVMGCYGIGVSRVLAACIEQNHDENGIIFPLPIAPFECLLIVLNPKDNKVLDAANKLYVELKKSRIDCLYDDRDERPGFKFKDADLIGVPIQIIIGAKGLAKGVAEIKIRRTGEKIEVPLSECIKSVIDLKSKNNF